jgi:hypothetical protein
MRILSFTRLVAAGTAAAAAKNGTAASFLKNDRRITLVDLTRMEPQGCERHRWASGEAE